LLLDFVAKRYSTLPSKVIESGDIIDIRCAEIALEYEEYVRKNRGKGKTINHRYSPDELAKQMEAVRKLNEHNTKP
jgi:hypothetical protein